MDPPRLATLGDHELMTLVRSGHGPAFAEVHRRHAPAALANARSIVGDAHRAHDVVQDAFLDAWRMARSYRSEKGTLPAWLLTIVRRRAIDLLRREARAAPLLRESEQWIEPEAAERVDEAAIGRDAARDLRRRVRRLPERQRGALALAYFGGLSHSEIAERLDVPLGTAKGAIRCGIEQLRLQMAG